MTSISGSVTVDGITIGTISGDYTDDSAYGTSEVINDVSIQLSVSVDSISIGNGSMSYQDYVTYNGGGSRTINVSGNVTSDSIDIGDINATLVDNYGKVTTTKTSNSWWPIVLLIGAFLLLSRKKRE